MKNYLGFAGADFQVKGGMDDFFGDYDTKDEAVKAIKRISQDMEKLSQFSNHIGFWAKVYGCKERDNVFEIKPKTFSDG